MSVWSTATTIQAMLVTLAVGHLRGAAVGLAAACLVSCNLPVYESPLSAETYTGAIDDSDMVVGAVLRDEQIRIYVCGGPESFASSRWFSGAVKDGSFELESRGWSLAGELIDGRLAGSLRLPGDIERSWVADAVGAGSVAGLYEARTGDCTSGLVAQEQPDGQIDAQGTWCDGRGNFDQIIILSPMVATSKGIEVEVAHASGDDTPSGQSFFVTRVVL